MQGENVDTQGAAPNPSEQGGCESVESLRNYLHSDKLKNAKKVLRNENITLHCSHRNNFWSEICRYHSKIPQSDSFYVNKAGNAGMASLASLPKFVDPVFADDYWLKKEAISRLYRIINTIGVSHTHVIYAPLLYPTTALLLHYLPHVEAYKAVCSLMENSRVHHMDQTPNMFSKSTLTFQKLTKKLAPKTYKWIEKSLASKNEEIAQFFLAWPLWVFRGLPLQYVVRVFDNFLLEGTRALYRSCLLILILYSQCGDTAPTLNTPKSTPKVKRKFDAASLMLDGILIFLRQNLPAMLNEEQFIGKAYSIRGFSSKLLSKLAASCDSQEITYVSSHIPLNVSSSKELALKQITLNTLDVSVLYFVSELNSSIATQSQLEELWSHLPARHTVVKPYLIFTANEHGTSLRNFFHMVDNAEPLVILVKTVEGDVLGAFCSTAWSERKNGRNFFGTGETFVFSFGKDDSIKVYKWVGYGASADTELSAGQQLFQCAVDGLDIGCGALHIPLDMNSGRSDRSSTFDNEPLARDREFQVIAFEAIAFE